MSFSHKIILLTATALAWAASMRAELADGIRAVVHDAVITHEEVESRTAISVGRNPISAKSLEQARSDNLEQLLARQLILHEFRTAYNVPESLLDKDVDERIREIIRTDYGDRMTFTKTLQAQGTTQEKYRQKIREEFIVGALRQKNVASEIIISPHKVESYYLAHQEDYKVGDQVKLKMIVITNAPKARAMAEEIVTKLNEGASFTEMAAVYSQGSQQLGDNGWVDKSFLRKELTDVAFSLKAGEHSGIVQPEGAPIYIMLVEDKRSSHFKSLGEVRDEIEKNLMLGERNRLEKQWIERLKKKTFVRYFE
jgi:peptidyl-prolyl cis-trans isomerase SurA